MNSRRVVTISRWVLAMSALGGIVLVYRGWFHVNPTTVALTLLLYILLLAAEWGLRYAVVVSVAATACYNFFFLPPVGTFVISDPQNWLALFAFLATAILASRLSERARREAAQARSRQDELEALFRLSRELLQSESLVSLLSSVPAAAASNTGARSAMLYLPDGERLFQAGPDTLTSKELAHLHHLSESLTEPLLESEQASLPLRSGVRPKGLLLLRGARLSAASADAVGGLVSLSIDRAQALENVARGDALKESERLRTLLIDSITHELRTPLTSIKGAATALLSQPQDETSRRELLTIIDEESDHMNRLVSEAVETAQLESHQVRMHLEPVRVEDLVAESLQACSPAVHQHPLEQHIDAGLQVRADTGILRKVLSNLLENAAKFSPASSPITLTASRAGNFVALSVADHGVGIESWEQPLIFERFYRGRSQADGTPGTGMGLAISRAIAEAHGGQIEVVSQAGKGSVFTVLLPHAAS